MKGDRNGYRDADKPRAYRTDQTCKGKPRYAEEMTVRAAGAVSLAERKNKERLWCYRCKHCHGWHLTSKGQGPRWEILADDPAPRAGRLVRGYLA